MKTDQFLSVPGNRAAARAISLQTVAKFAPSETKMNKRFIEPLLDMVARGESLTAEAGDASMGLGGADLVLMIVVPAVVQVLIQLLSELQGDNIDAIKAWAQKYKGDKRLVNIYAVDAVSEIGMSAQVLLPKLRQVLVEYFSESELRDLCFDLAVDYESLPSEDKGDLAREMVAHLERRARTSELVEIIKRLRPNIPWGDKPKATIGEPSMPQGAPSVHIEITFQDVQGLVVGTRFGRNKKRIQELVDVISTAVQDYLTG